MVYDKDVNLKMNKNFRHDLIYTVSRLFNKLFLKKIKIRSIIGYF